MNTDYRLDQGLWLDQNVMDVQSRGGVCHAMATEWLFALIQGERWDAQAEYWRAVSHQRAYALTWQDALRGYWGGEHYILFLGIALRHTERFVADPARRKGRPFHRDHVFALNQLPPYIQALGAATGMVISMIGSNAQSPADAQNWGHSVAVVREGDGTFRFLDVNYGQYSWPAVGPASTAAREVVAELQKHYGNWGIRDIYLFRVG